MRAVQPDGRDRAWPEGGAHPRLARRCVGQGDRRRRDRRRRRDKDRRMSNFRTLDDLGDVRGKVALVRVDLTLPMNGGTVTDDTRVRASAPTILELADAGAKVLLLAHFGRPKGARDPNQSLSRVIDCVEHVLGREVMYCSEIAGAM